MIHSLVCTTLLCAVLLSGLVLPPDAHACPVKMPETLLNLYRNSDEIHVARFGRADPVAVTSETEEFTVVQMRHRFDVSSTLKGEPRKLFAYENTEYQYKQNHETEEPEETEETEETNVAETEKESETEQPEEPEPEPTDEESDSEMKSGDLVLLFLKEEILAEVEGETTPTKKQDEKPVLVPIDYRDGIKRVKPADLSVFEARIGELNEIFKGDKANPATVVSWLIRCMEHSATRWDGASELADSFRTVERELEEKRERAARGESEEEDETTDRVYGGWGGSTMNPEYARATTEADKQRITNILISPSDQQPSGTKENLSRGEYALIELVRQWADDKVAGYLLERMQRPKEEPWTISNMMDVVAEVLDDEDVTAIAAKYSDAANGEDGEEYEESDDEESEAEEANETADANEGEKDNSPPVSKSADEPKAEDETLPAVKKPTYFEVRSRLFARFVAAANAALTRPESEREASK